jgi:hypothetical protein
MVVAIKDDSSSHRLESMRILHAIGPELERIFVDILMSSDILISFIKIRHNIICTGYANDLMCQNRD